MPAFLENLFSDIRKDPKMTDPGLTSYFELIEVLRSGRAGVRTFGDMAFLLEACWLKSQDQQVRFRELINMRREGLTALLEAFLENTNQETVEGASGSVNIIGKPEPTVTQDTVIETQETGREMNEVQTEDVVRTEEQLGSYHFVLDTGSSENHVQVTGPPVQRGAHHRNFLFTRDYLPVGNRQLRQAWRSLQLESPGGDTDRLDMIKTVNFSAKQGFFSDFFYRKKKVNQLKIFFFIDSGSSMLAEESMCEELLRTAQASHIGNAVVPLYFKDIPQFDLKQNDWIFTDKNEMESFYLKRLCLQLPKRNVAALVLSEAGTLREDNDPAKLTVTQSFVQALHRQIESVIWINPAPKSRWTNNRSLYLATQVGLFDSNRSDIEKAIASLSGKQVIKTTISHAANQN
jgi:hypothetical protein